jgi:hypothetical protein
MTEQNRYKNGKIYTIRYRGDKDLIYVGSTTQLLHKRWYEHKKNCLNENNIQYHMKLYQKMRETNDIENWHIELYEDFSCDRKEQLHKREGEIIREKSTLNRYIAGRTNEEYRHENKEKIQIINQVYQEKNKHKLSEYKRQYYAEHKQDTIQKAKEYRLTNYENVKQKQVEKILCICGCEISRTNLSQHKKSKKHLDSMSEKQQEATKKDNINII